MVGLSHLPVQSRLKITDCLFRCAAPQLWNKLPHTLRVPHQSVASYISSQSSSSDTRPAVNLSHGLFHSRLKTRLFSKSSTLQFLSLSLSRTQLTDHRPARVLEVFVNVNFGKVRQIKPTQLAVRRYYFLFIYLLDCLLTYWWLVVVNSGGDVVGDSSRQHQLQVQTSRQTLMSSLDSESTNVRNTRRTKQKVLFAKFFHKFFSF